MAVSICPVDHRADTDALSLTYRAVKR
jgi:hypothetical protein